MGPTLIKAATTKSQLRKKVLWFAISSRLFILILSFISNLVIPDHNAGVFKFPHLPTNNSIYDEVIEVGLGGLARWDAQYFLHISHHGYTYENTLAFYPLFPFFTRTFAYILSYAVGSSLNQLSIVLLSAVSVNVFFFVNAATKLFDLSVVILQDDELAYISALFFCVNPASIFFTAPYSESCFVFFMISGVLFCLGKDKELLSSLVLGLSCCIRSNGVLNIGFLAHKILKSIILHDYNKQLFFSYIYFIYCELLKLLVCAVIFFSPFIMFQCFAFSKFCDGENDLSDFLKEFGNSEGFVMPGSNTSPWCDSTIPFSYSYVQNHYWEVGFLQYYKFRQIPNFCLAFPVIYLVLSNSYLFLVENKHSVLTLGFNSSRFVTFQGRKLRPEFFVFVAHSMFLTLFCVLFVHVQVTTRMIASSCPVLYWFIALRYHNKPGKTDTNKINTTTKFDTSSAQQYSFVESQKNIDSLWKTIILTGQTKDRWTCEYERLYCVSYLVIGTVLFSNFLPWT